MPARLVQIISLLYRYQSADTEALETELLNSRKRAWRLALEEEAFVMGCSGAVKPPSGQDLIELTATSHEDAQSISETWNRDVERQIQRLFDKNPRGNRNYYASNLERWAAQRSTWKQPQIALQTEQ